MVDFTFVDPATAAGARGAGVDPGGVAGPLTRGSPGSLGAGGGAGCRRAGDGRLCARAHPHMNYPQGVPGRPVAPGALNGGLVLLVASDAFKFPGARGLGA